MRIMWSNIKFLSTLFFYCTVLFAAATSTYADVNVQQFKTPKNIMVIYLEDKTTDLTTVRFAFKGAGASIDPRGKEGLSNLMMDVLFERTKPDSTRNILNKKLLTLGVLDGLQYAVSMDDISLGFKAPTENLKNVFDIISIYFNDLALDPKELAKMKSYDPSGARLASSDNTEFANKILMQRLMQDHAYANPPSGTIDGRQAVTIADIKQALQQRFARDNLVFVVSGKVPKADISKYIDATFGKLPEKGLLKSVPDLVVKTSGDVTVIPKDSAQSGVVFGHNGVTLQDPDYFPMMILNDIMGGKAFTSRLWMEARENRGHVYDIRTGLLSFDKGGLWMGSFQSDHSKVQEVVALIRETWQNMHDQGVTEAEFTASKTGQIGSFALNFTSPDGIVNYILQSYLCDLPIDYINKRNQELQAVTLIDVNRAAKKHLDPKGLTFVVVGEAH